MHNIRSSEATCRENSLLKASQCKRLLYIHPERFSITHSLNPLRALGSPQVSDETSPRCPVLSSPHHVIFLQVFLINFACESAPQCVFWSAASFSSVWPPAEGLLRYYLLEHSDDMTVHFSARNLQLFDDVLLTCSSSQLVLNDMVKPPNFHDCPQTAALEPAYYFFYLFQPIP